MLVMHRAALRTVALLLAATGLAVPATLAPAQAAASSNCVVTERPLAAATGYTEFIAGNGSRGSESEGAIAWGGNLNANGMTVGTRLSSAPGDPTLVVAGTHGTFNLQKGSAYVVPKSGVNFNGGGSYLNSNPIDFAGAFSTLTARSEAWGNAAANGTAALGVVAGQNYLVLTGTDPQLNVFSLTPAQLTSGAGIAYNVPAGSTVLVNVAATTVALQGQMWIKQNGNYTQVQDDVMKSSWPGILWNFPNATSITMNVGSAWGGSILAPKANLAVSNVGHTIGQMIADRFSSNFETHQNNFPSSACLPPLSTTPPAENPSVRLTKSASAVNDLDGNGTDAGDTITYSFSVKNTGDVTLTQLALSDPLLGAVTCPSGPLAAGATTTCTSKTYTVTSNDIAAGSRSNTATVSATSPNGTTVTDDDSVTTPLIVSKANLKFTKSVDKTSPQVGETVTYTLTATNNGTAAAADVVISDRLPAGVTYLSASSGCSYADGTVTCSVASLAAGGSVSVQVRATVDALVTGAAAAQHELDVQKAEEQVDLEPGQTRTVQVRCAPGYLVVDGSTRTDAVDQGTGTLADVRVLESYSSAADTWTVTLRNDAEGRAQGKAFAVCLEDTTGSASGHAHPVVISGPVTAAGSGSTTLSCAAGTVPVAPGFRFASPSTVSSVPAGTDAWTFTTSGFGSYSVRCLSTKVGESAGHQHDLDLTQLSRTVSVPAGEVQEFQLTCADDAKGIVAGFRAGTGLVNLGNDPRPKTRAFRFSNPTSAPVQAELWLLCLKTRTAGANAQGTVVNTASASTTSLESSYADNGASASFTIAPSVAAAEPTVAVSGSRVATRVSCSNGRTACAGTATLVAAQDQRINGRLVRKGTVLAKATYRVAAGKKSVVRLAATRAGAPVLRAKGFKRAVLKVGGRSRAVSVRH